MNQKKAHEVRVSRETNHGKATDSILLDVKSLKSVGIIDCDGIQSARSEVKQHVCEDVIVAREYISEVIVA